MIPPSGGPFEDFNSRFHLQARRLHLRAGEPQAMPEETWAAQVDFSRTLPELPPQTVLVLAMLEQGQSDEQIAGNLKLPLHDARRVIRSVLQRVRQAGPKGGSIDVTG